MITIVPVTNEKEKLRFIKSQWNFYHGDPYFVPPLIMDRKKLLDQKKNPFYTHAQMQLWMAEENGEIVGRIGAIVNDNHNKTHNDKVGFFGFFECSNRQDVAKMLLDTAKVWLKQRGMDTMRGPANPSMNDETGLLVDGFDDSPRILMTYNPRYYANLLEKYGLKKSKDLWAWKIRRDTVITPKLERVARLVEERSKVTLRCVNMKNLKSELALVKDIYNKAWEKNWGFVPMTNEEIDFIANDLKSIVNPKYVYFAEKDGKTVGFSLTLPDVNQVLRSNKKGHLLPAIPKLLFGLKKVTWSRIVILGVLPEYRHIGIDALMYYHTAIDCGNAGITAGEASWVLEDNIMMNRAAELMNAEKYKTYRMYDMAV